MLQDVYSPSKNLPGRRSLRPVPFKLSSQITNRHPGQFLVGVFASLGSLLFGYDLGVIAEVVASSSYTALFNPTAAQT